MESLVYLMRATITNTLKEIRKKPAQMAVYGLLAFAILSMMIMSSRMEAATSGMQLANAVGALQTGAFILLIFLSGYYVTKGLDTGGSFFSMADAGLLFVSPVDPIHVLTYGMVKQAGTALLGGVVILAQAANLRNFFGLGVGGTIAVFFGYALSLVASEGLAMMIYGLTNGRRRRKALVYALLVAILLPVAAVAVRGVLQNGLAAGIVAAGTSPFAAAIPIAGWTAAGIAAFARGNLLAGLGFFGLNILLFLASVLLLRRHGSDFYEDVLVATERSASVKAAQASGDLNESNALRRRVRVRGTGIFGWGASAIMGRQLRESFRLNPLKLLDSYSFTIIAMAAIMAYMNRGISSGGGVLLTFAITAYMQMAFMTITGPVRELTSHYIFLIPEKPIKKLLWNNGAAALKALCESVIAYVAVGFILGLSPQTVAAAILCNTCFCFMLFSINVWGLRFFGTVINRGIMLMAYLAIAVVAMLPGIIYVIAVAFAQPELLETMVTPFLNLAVWEVLMTALFTYLSRNVLHNIDMIKIEVRK